MLSLISLDGLTLEQLRPWFERHVELSRSGGPWGLAALAVTGLAVVLALLSFLSTFVAPSTFVRRVSGATVVMVLLTVGVSAGAYFVIRQDTEKHAASARYPSEREVLIYERSGKALAPMRLSLPLGALALGVGAFGLLVAARRRWKEDAPFESSALWFTMTTLGLAALVGGWELLQLPIPGKPHTPEQLQVLKLRDQLDEGEYERCLSPGLTLAADHPAMAMPELRDSRNRCLGHYLGLLKPRSPEGGAARPDAAVRVDPTHEKKVRQLLAGSFLEDAHKDILSARLQEQLGGSAPPPPAPVEDGRTAERVLEDRAQRCAQQLPKRMKKRGVRLEVDVQIDPSGKVTDVTTTGKSSSVLATRCVTEALSRTTVPGAGTARTTKLVLTLGGRR
jgi:hypothetical protein